MRYFATAQALNKLNKYGVNEIDIRNEIKERIKLNEKGFDAGLKINFKLRDIVALPVGKKTAIIFENGIPLEKSYEDLPIIRYKEGKWEMK